MEHCENLGADLSSGEKDVFYCPMQMSWHAPLQILAEQTDFNITYTMVMQPLFGSLSSRFTLSLGGSSTTVSGNAGKGSDRTIHQPINSPSSEKGQLNAVLCRLSESE